MASLMMRSTVTFALIALMALSCQAETTHMQVDKQVLHQMTKDVGVDSLLELSAEPTVDSSHAATPVDVESGDFEIKCSTSCEFVKKGYGQFSQPGIGRGAISIADQLQKLQERMQRLEVQITASPNDQGLRKEKDKLEGDIRAKTLVLQSAVKGNLPETAGVPAEEAADLAASQRKLKDMQKQLAQSPDNPALRAARDSLKAEVDGKNAALAAASSAQAEKEKLDKEVVVLGKQLVGLKEKVSRMPNDAALKAEMEKVKAQLSEKSAASSSLNPKEECYRVCVHPTMRKSAANGGDPAKVNNCIRMCVKVMRMLVYKMAKKFL